MVSYIGYNAFNQVLAGQAIHQLRPAIPATSPVSLTGFALVALTLAAVGYDKIHLAQRAFAFLMITILTVFSCGALFLVHLPAAQWDPGGFHGVPFLAQLFAAASYQLSWSIYVSDYSRYLPPNVGRARIILVDVPRRLHRRGLDDAGRHRRGRRRPEARRRRRDGICG